MSNYVSLSEAIEMFIVATEVRVAEKTMKWYRYSLSVLVQSLGEETDVTKITTHHLRKWRNGCLARVAYKSGNSARPTKNKRVSKASVRSYVQACRTFFKWLHDEGVIPNNPAKRLEQVRGGKSEPKCISVEDLKAILETNHHLPREHAILTFLFTTACRRGGIAGLKINDLTLARSEAIVTEKGNRTRVVIMNDQSVSAMYRWLALRPKTKPNNSCDCVDEFCSHVFVGRRGALTPDGIYDVVKKAALRAGVTENVNPHAYRHGRARQLIEKNMEMALVSQFLGHTSLHVTDQFYSRLSTQRLKHAVESFANTDI